MNSSVISQGRNFIISTQNSDGGWGYFENQKSSLEPTACALSCISISEDHQIEEQRAVEWILSGQNKDGGWGIDIDDSESGWQTSWAVLALNPYPDQSRMIQKAAQFLLDFAAYNFGDSESDQSIKQNFNIDTDLNGWPWQPEQASWIEPTAMSLLALQAVDPASSENDRVKEAIAYLDDRRCRGGGWNFGNPVMFSKDLPPSTHHSALSILTLARLEPHLILEKDVSTLISLVDEEERPLGLAMGILALKAVQEDTSQFVGNLSAIQDGDGSWEGNVYFSALSLIALTDVEGMFM